MVKVKTNEGIEELELLVHEEKEKDLIVQVLILYPVTWDTVKKMILTGLKSYQIKQMCTMWYERGKNINIEWDNIKTLLNIL